MRKKPIAYVSVCACLLVPSAATASTITFDNLPATGCFPSSPVPVGYDGLNWSNFGYTNATQFPCSIEGYGVVLTSSPNVGFNSVGADASISDDSPFIAVSADFAAAWNEGLTLTVTGKNNGVTVGIDTLLLTTTTKNFMTFDFGPVTELDFSSSGGVENPSLVTFGHGTQFGMDNLTIAPVTVTTVPEPLSLLLLGSGLAVAGVRLRRHR